LVALVPRVTVMPKVCRAECRNTTVIVSNEPNFVGGPWNGRCKGWQGPVERQERLEPTNMPTQPRRLCFGTLTESSRAALQQLVSGPILRPAELGADHDRCGQVNSSVSRSVAWHRGQLSVNVLSASFIGVLSLDASSFAYQRSAHQGCLGLI
jgi:hypothetical protein